MDLPKTTQAMPYNDHHTTQVHVAVWLSKRRQRKTDLPGSEQIAFHQKKATQTIDF